MVQSNPLCQVKEETKHLAEVVTTHVGCFLIHIWVTVEDFKQVAHLFECFFIAQYFTFCSISERSQDQIDGLFGIRAVSEVSLFKLIIDELLDLSGEDLVQNLSNLTLAYSTSSFTIGTDYFTKLFFQQIFQLHII